MMRNFGRGLDDVLTELWIHTGRTGRKAALESLCQVEIGLRLQERMAPDGPAAHAWVLFSGYPYAAEWFDPLPPDSEHVLRVARHSLWTVRRRRAWREALERYQRYDCTLRGFDVPDPDRPADRREVSVAVRRWDDYERLLCVAPPLAGEIPAVATAGPHSFPVGRSTAVVDLPSVPVTPLVAHDLDALQPGKGEPLAFSLKELAHTAAAMDARNFRDWAGRLRALTLTIRTADGFEHSDTFTVDRIQHLLGIVGAGKSTLRDIIAVHLATRSDKRTTTVVVSDVAEVLKLVKLYNEYTDGAAAPVLGAAGRQRHAQRLHRRIAGRGEQRLLAHDDSSFAYLSTSCVLNVLRRGTTGGETLAFGEAPCTRLHAPFPRREDPGDEHGTIRWQKTSKSCPYWASCPRHHAARELASADIWVATPQSLVDASPPIPQNGVRIRYLELACRRSDLVIVDEADRVQMQLDQTFAPAVLLAGGDDEESFIDKLTRHKIREFSVAGRVQLSDRDVENFAAALNTAVAATDRIYAMLVADHELRRWVRTGYFSAWTLQLGLLDERCPLPDDAEENTPYPEVRELLGNRLDAFRDNPFGDRFRVDEEADDELTSLLGELLHTSNPDNTRRRLTRIMDDVFKIDKTFMDTKKKQYEARRAEWEEQCELKRKNGGRQKKLPPPPETPEQWCAELAKRFEFTLLLCALEPKLALINAMWPRAEATLNLGYNSMYRRPIDYGPMVPEAPMGNVLGFQFHVRGQDEGGIRSGELKFFRCSGVGRELLRAMPDLPTVDGRPGTNVLLMSGSSWAGSSSRYHVPVPVGVIIEPPSEVMQRIARESSMRFEFIDEAGEKLRISGTDPDERPEKLRRIARRLGASVDEVEDGGPLEKELLALPKGRDQILLLVGSYEEARVVADTLHNLNQRWFDRVLRLVSDDEDLDDEAPYDDSGHRARVLRRSDVEHLKDCKADILVAPLLAVERGHNILNDADVAAIGTVYFLARPNPHPDDISLAVNAINDWVVRAMDSGEFGEWVRSGSSVDDGAEEVRRRARSRWYQVLQRSMAWSRLGKDREQVTWDMLVLMWQVIGRLVRGGVPARVVFVDSAFAPNRTAVPPQPDTAESSLLHSVLDVLRPYFAEGSEVSAHERFIARALYEPLWETLNRCLHPLAGVSADHSAPSGGSACTR
ncbi:pPIWI_RE_Z domain-containing protein [Streptomyces sp. NPDC054863]